MKTLSEYINSSDPSDLINKLFEARQTTHVLHLKTKSYAQHMALDSFYGDILGLIDEFVEVYQGQYGIIDQASSISVDKSADPVKYLEELCAFVKKARKALAEEDTHLQNIVDEITATTYRTLYKLKFLK